MCMDVAFLPVLSFICASQLCMMSARIGDSSAIRHSCDRVLQTRVQQLPLICMGEVCNSEVEHMLCMQKVPDLVLRQGTQKILV